MKNLLYIADYIVFKQNGMKSRAAFFIVFSVLLFTGNICAQDGKSFSDGLPEFGPLPEVELLPANITLYNSGISLLPAGHGMMGFGGYPSGSRKTVPDLNSWTKNYIRANNLRNISRNPTLVSGDLMGYALRSKSMANQELYHTYVLMNRESAGNTQLGRMYGGPGSVVYIDFIGLGVLAVEYLLYMVER